MDSTSDNNSEFGVTSIPDENSEAGGNVDTQQAPELVYEVPDWFRNFNVKKKAELLEYQTNIVLVDDEEKDDDTKKDPTQTKDTANTEKAAGSKDSDDAAPSTAQTETAPKFDISRRLYAELHDVTASALLTKYDDENTTSYPTVLLRGHFDGTEHLTDSLLKHLAKEMGAELISFDLEDLEDLGREFRRQDPIPEPEDEAKNEDEKEDKTDQEKKEENGKTVEEEKTKKEDEAPAKSDAEQVSNGDADESKETTSSTLSPEKQSSAEGEGKKDENEEAKEATQSAEVEPSKDGEENAEESSSSSTPVKDEPNLKSSYGLSEFYFSLSSTASTEATERNARAIKAIFQSRKPQNKEPEASEGSEKVESGEGSEFVFIHFHDANRLTEQPDAEKFLLQIRDQSRKLHSTSIKPVVFVSLCTNAAPFKKSVSCSCAECQKTADVETPNDDETRLRENLGVDPTAIFSFKKLKNEKQASACTKADERRIRLINLRRVGRALPKSSAMDSIKDTVTFWSKWESLKDEDTPAIFGKSLWSSADITRAEKQFLGRLWGKSELTFEDIKIVLERVFADSSKKEEKKDEENSEFAKKIEDLREKCDEYEKKLLDGVIDPKQLKSTYDDVIMDEETKETVQNLLAMSKLQSKVSSHRLLDQMRMNGALFYGPPGTGKTHLSRAIAKDTNANMLAIDPASIQNMWVGETESLIKAAFSLSRKLHPCVLFIDEIDALFYRRSSCDTSWQRTALTQFLMEMDGLGTNDKSPFVVGATNRPSDLDEAFLRRLPMKVPFTLPNLADRKQIIQLFLDDADLDSSVTMQQIAQMTKGYSGSDLKNFCSQAALIWMMEQAKSSNDDDTSKAEDTEQGNKPVRAVLKLSFKHISKALLKAKASTAPHTTQQIQEFARRFSPGTQFANVMN